MCKPLKKQQLCLNRKQQEWPKCIQMFSCEQNSFLGKKYYFNYELTIKVKKNAALFYSYSRYSKSIWTWAERLKWELYKEG